MRKTGDIYCSTCRKVVTGKSIACARKGHKLLLPRPVKADVKKRLLAFWNDEAQRMDETP